MMNDTVAEKLAQKVANLIEEVTDVNLLVRRLPPPQETINKIHERIQIIQTGIVETTEKMKKNETATSDSAAAIRKLEQEVKTLQEGQEKVARSLNEALQSINNAANDMIRQSFDLQQKIAPRMDKVSEILWALKIWVIAFTIGTGLLVLGYILKAIF